MPFAFPGQPMPDHIGRKKRRIEASWGYAPSEGGGAPPGFSLWTTNGQVWRFGAQAQRAISPSRT